MIKQGDKDAAHELALRIDDLIRGFEFGRDHLKVVSIERLPDGSVTVIIEEV
jgi:hypothetical protein